MAAEASSEMAGNVQSGLALSTATRYDLLAMIEHKIVWCDDDAAAGLSSK